MSPHHNSGIPAPGLPRILPLPTRAEEIEAALSLHRQHLALYQGEFEAARQAIAYHTERRGRACDNIDSAEAAIERLTAEQADMNRLAAATRERQI